MKPAKAKRHEPQTSREEAKTMKTAISRREFFALAAAAALAIIAGDDDEDG